MPITFIRDDNEEVTLGLKSSMVGRNFLAALLLIFFSVFACMSWAQSTTGIQLVGMTNYFYTSTVNASGATIFAGSTSASCPTTNGTDPCDSCTTLTSVQDGALSEVCNNRQIYPDLRLTLTIRTGSADSFASGSRIAMQRSGATSGVIDPVSQPSSIGPNTNMTVSFLWRDICANSGTASADPDCKFSFSTEFRLGIDKDGGGSSLVESVPIRIRFRYVQTSEHQNFGCSPAGDLHGFCYFTVFPGDAKVFVDARVRDSNNLRVPKLDNSTTGAPTSGGLSDPSTMSYSALRIFYDGNPGASFSTITPTSGYADLAYANGALTAKRVTGLKNGNQYTFLSASVDQAGNVTHFNNPTLTGCVVNTTLCDNITPAFYGASQSAIPQEVFGLLDRNRCFIATAAFGSPWAPPVEVLREFRDQLLLKTNWGKAFVSWYYRWSPPAAAYLEQSMVARVVVQTVLWPLVGIAALFLLVGASGGSMCLFAGVIALGTWAFWRRRSNRSSGLRWPR